MLKIWIRRIIELWNSSRKIDEFIIKNHLKAENIGSESGTQVYFSTLQILHYINSFLDVKWTILGRSPTQVFFQGGRLLISPVRLEAIVSKLEQSRLGFSICDVSKFSLNWHAQWLWRPCFLQFHIFRCSYLWSISEKWNIICNRYLNFYRNSRVSISYY